MTRPPGTPVVLYACTTHYGNTEQLLADLRAHAVAHGWNVVAEHADATGAAPEAERPAFLKAKALLTSGAAEGMLSRYPAMAAYHPHEQAAFRDWLEVRGAWVHYTWPAPRHRHPRPDGDDSVDPCGIPAAEVAR
ncbi:recombinase family protein [Streptomyces sp. RKAG337]|uniref:recombinase family protein n=1 Tax=Streptomyces sp. RKAG337 TaxID=2893404 RepID=UPI002033E464|nr:recombinase family protein [Streptomyces sp. RKAG337]MCM2427399.1 recombinase family protein [Streptomyces sp. RKAG337]